MMKLSIADLLSRVLKSEPRKEITGFLLVHRNTTQEFIRVKNLSSNCYSFFITDQDVDAIKKYASKNSAIIYAFIHSHHETTYMSINDKVNFRLSEFNWIIITLYENELKWQFYPNKQESINKEVINFILLNGL